METEGSQIWGVQPTGKEQVKEGLLFSSLAVRKVFSDFSILSKLSSKGIGQKSADQKTWSGTFLCGLDLSISCVSAVRWEA